MAANSGPLKGILKNPSDTKDVPTSASDNARALAVHHATILQQRKDVESEILDHVILLSEYPLVRSPDYSASSPAPSDVDSFKSLIRLFQPSDYDDLIEERNVNGLCGYPLCPRPRRNTGPGGEWTIAASGEIVKRKELEMWCSKQCTKRAMYVKVQLNETGAWERAGIPDIQIDLWGEDLALESEADQTARKLAELNLEVQRHVARDSAALALERGQRGAVNAIKTIPIELQEKEVRPLQDSTDVFDVEDDHLLVEGHRSKFTTSTAAKET